MKIMKRFFTFIMTVPVVMIFTAQVFAESPKAQMHRVFGNELKARYSDRSLRPGVSSLCQYITRYQSTYLPDTTKLDYDLEEQHREAWDKTFNTIKMYAQMYATSNEEEHTVADIFVEECKNHVGHYLIIPGLKPRWLDHDELEADIARQKAKRK